MTRRPAWSLAALLVCLPGAAASQQDAAQRDLGPQLDRIFAEYANRKAPGCAVGVAREGRVLAARGYGAANLDTGEPVTPSTAMDIGSVSKQFTAAAALLLEGRGTVTLDDPIGQWLPGLPTSTPAIRVRDLLHHTSGLRDYSTLERLADRQVSTMDDFLALMRRQRGLNFVPGSRHEYSHSDYAVLGAVIERVTGEPLGRFLAREVWAPAGLAGTRLNDQLGLPIPGRALAYAARSDGSFRTRFPTSELIGGDNVYTSVVDLLRWGIAADQSPGAGWLDRLAARPTLHGDTIPYAHGLWTGRYRGLPMITRGGGGAFHTRLVRFPAQRVTVATLCNRADSNPYGLSLQVADAVLAEALAEPVAEPEPPSGAAPESELLRYRGDYHPPDEPWNYNTIGIHNGGLVDEYAGQSYPLVRLGEGDYADHGLRYRFRTGARGIELEITGEELPEVLVRRPDQPRWRPNAAVLRAVAGGYASSDLDAVWQLAVRDGGLVIERPGRRALALSPVETDLFRGQLDGEEPLLFGVRVTRNGAGRINGLTVSASPQFEVVRQVRFERYR